MTVEERLREKYRAAVIDQSFARDAAVRANERLERALAEVQQAATDYIQFLREQVQ